METIESSNGGTKANDSDLLNGQMLSLPAIITLLVLLP